MSKIEILHCEWLKKRYDLVVAHGWGTTADMIRLTISLIGSKDSALSIGPFRKGHSSVFPTRLFVACISTSLFLNCGSGPIANNGAWSQAMFACDCHRPNCPDNLEHKTTEFQPFVASRKIYLLTIASLWY